MFSWRNKKNVNIFCRKKVAYLVLWSHTIIHDTPGRKASYPHHDLAFIIRIKLIKILLYKIFMYRMNDFPLAHNFVFNHQKFGLRCGVNEISRFVILLQYCDCLDLRGMNSLSRVITPSKYVCSF